MRVIRVIGNNGVVTVDSNGVEFVVLGKGIGFQKKCGDFIDDSKVESIYKMSKKVASQFEQIVLDVPRAHINVANKVIKYAQDSLNCKLNENIYITLTDHINFAIERIKQGIILSNVLLWETKKFYSKEYEIGLKALDIISQDLGLELSEDEAGFIALHIVNAQFNIEMSDTVKAPVFVRDVVEIVKDYFKIDVVEDTISYDRFVTHLKYFSQRVIKKEYYSSSDNTFHKIFLEEHPKSRDCAKLISKYIEEKYSYDISDEELMYLALHIERIVNREKNSV